jgi:hypothetical protein
MNDCMDMCPNLPITSTYCTNSFLLLFNLGKNDSPSLLQLRYVQWLKWAGSVRIADSVLGNCDLVAITMIPYNNVGDRVKV